MGYKKVNISFVIIISLFVLGILISIGTTLPELSVSISASRKKLGNIAVGNGIGSCITNLLLVLGISALIYPISITASGIFYSLAFLSFISLILLFFMETDWMIKKLEGIFLILIYVVFILLVISGTL